MKAKKTILKDLLFFFCDLCDDNGFDYSFIGEPAQVVLNTGSLPISYNSLTVAVPYGQIQKLIPLINDAPTCPYFLRYVMNDPHAKKINYALLDPSFTTVNFRNYNNRGFNSAYLNIIELEKKGKSKEHKRYKNIIRFINSNKWDLKKPKKCLRMIKWKSTCRIKGKDQFLQNLLDERKQVLGLEDWNDACNQDYVMLKENVFPGELLRDVRAVDLNGHKVRIAPVLTDHDYTKGCFYSMKKESVFQTDLGPIDSEFLNSKECQKQIQSVLNDLENYNNLVAACKPDSDIIRQMWQTYKMVVDTKQFEEMFDEDRIAEISSYLDNNEIVAAELALKPYIRAKQKYQKYDVAFIENPNMDSVVNRYNKMIEE